MRSSRRTASRPVIRYLWSGDTSNNAAELRTAAYSRSGCGSYALATWWPAQRRQVCALTSLAVRGWNGVVFSMVGSLSGRGGVLQAFQTAFSIAENEPERRRDRGGVSSDFRTI